MPAARVPLLDERMTRMGTSSLERPLRKPASSPATIVVGPTRTSTFDFDGDTRTSNGSSCPPVDFDLALRQSPTCTRLHFGPGATHASR